MHTMIAAPAGSRPARGPGYAPVAEPAGDLSACRACPLHAMATQVVPGMGPDDARLMIVGEQPGDREDLEGKPFVGPSASCWMKPCAGSRWIGAPSTSPMR